MKTNPRNKLFVLGCVAASIILPACTSGQQARHDHRVDRRYDRYDDRDHRQDHREYRRGERRDNRWGY